MKAKSKYITVEIDLDNPPTMTEAELVELDKLPINADDELPEDIDWTGAVRGGLYKPVKRQITLRLDADMVEWFKGQGGKYQTKINQVLRDYMSERQG